MSKKKGEKKAPEEGEKKKKRIREAHLLEKLKYRELLKICRKEEISRKGRKVSIIRRLAEALNPKEIRKWYSEFRGTEVSIGGHSLVPEHKIMEEKEMEKLLKRFNCTKEDLPRILDTDPIVIKIGAKPGDVLKIIRNSQTAGKADYYRLVTRNV